MKERFFVHRTDDRRAEISQDGTQITIHTGDSKRTIQLEGLFVEELLAASLVRLGYLDGVEQRIPDDVDSPLNLDVVVDNLVDNHNQHAAWAIKGAMDFLYRRAEHRKAMGIYGKPA